MLNKPARRLFDRREAFVGAECINTKQARKGELTEVAPWCCQLRLTRMGKRSRGVMYAAQRQGAAGDVTRGVRQNGQQ